MAKPELKPIHKTAYEATTKKCDDNTYNHTVAIRIPVKPHVGMKHLHMPSS